MCECVCVGAADQNPALQLEGCKCEDELQRACCRLLVGVLCACLHAISAQLGTSTTITVFWTMHARRPRYVCLGSINVGSWGKLLLLSEELFARLFVFRKTILSYHMYVSPRYICVCMHLVVGGRDSLAAATTTTTTPTSIIWWFALALSVTLVIRLIMGDRWWLGRVLLIGLVLIFWLSVTVTGHTRPHSRVGSYYSLSFISRSLFRFQG